LYYINIIQADQQQLFTSQNYGANSYNSNNKIWN